MNSLTKRVLSVGAALSLHICACATTQSRTGAASSRTDFALRDLSGRTVRLSDYLGRNVVLLNFWATWCMPCAAELPQLNRMYERYKRRDFVVIGIAMDGPETVANVVPTARRHRLTFPILLDEETRVVGAYNPKRTAPYSVLIGRDGTVVKTREGYVSGDETAIESDVVAQLDKIGE